MCIFKGLSNIPVLEFETALWKSELLSKLFIEIECNDLLISYALKLNDDDDDNDDETMYIFMLLLLHFFV